MFKVLRLLCKSFTSISYHNLKIPAITIYLKYLEMDRENKYPYFLKYMSPQLTVFVV